MVLRTDHIRWSEGLLTCSPLLLQVLLGCNGEVFALVAGLDLSVVRFKILLVSNNRLQLDLVLLSHVLLVEVLLVLQQFSQLTHKVEFLHLE